jgi:hypothetical protein
LGVSSQDNFDDENRAQAAQRIWSPPKHGHASLGKRLVDLASIGLVWRVTLHSNVPGISRDLVIGRHLGATQSQVLDKPSGSVYHKRAKATGRRFGISYSG